MHLRENRLRRWVAQRIEWGVFEGDITEFQWIVELEQPTR